MLELRNVTKTFGQTRAVDSISLTVQRGEIVSLLGPSGCGKTTTLRLIAGFEQLDAGEILIDGASVANRRPYERNVGLVFQSYALFPHMSVAENIAYGLRYRDWPKAQITDRVAQMIKLVKLDGMETRFPTNLSGGQQQRVALARALATNPPVVLLDEPLSALDAKLRHELRIELKEILRSVDATTIIVTHDQEEAMGMAERIIVLRQGRIQQEGKPEEIYARPKNRFVAEFIGHSNWLSGNSSAAEAGLCKIQSDSGASISIPAQPDAGESKFDIGIRPELIDIVDGAVQQSKPTETLFEGTILDIAPLGAERQIIVQLRSGEKFLVVEQSRTTALSAGQQIQLRIEATDCIVLHRDN